MHLIKNTNLEGGQLFHADAISMFVLHVGIFLFMNHAIVRDWFNHLVPHLPSSHLVLVQCSTTFRLGSGVLHRAQLFCAVTHFAADLTASFLFLCSPLTFRRIGFFLRLYRPRCNTGFIAPSSSFIPGISKLIMFVLLPSESTHCWITLLVSTGLIPSAAVPIVT